MRSTLGSERQQGNATPQPTLVCRKFSVPHSDGTRLVMAFVDVFNSFRECCDRTFKREQNKVVRNIAHTPDIQFNFVLRIMYV